MKKRLAICLLVSLLLFCTACRVPDQVQNVIKNPLLSHMTGLEIGTHKISVVEFNYFYMDCITEFAGSYESYLSYFIADDKPLSEQIYDEESGETWADYFVNMAIDSAHNTYALYDAAVAASYTYTAEESISDTLKNQANLLGFKSVDDYLQSVYGDGATEATYSDYFEKTQIAEGYYAAYSKELRNSYTDEDLAEYEADKSYRYRSYSYAVANLRQEWFADNPNPEAALRDAANSLCDEENNTVDKLVEAVDLLDLPAPYYDVISVNEGVPYEAVNSHLQDWLAAEHRLEGDLIAIPYTSGSDKAGYYVFLMLETNDHRYPLANVRHILISYEGGVYDKSTGTTKYSDAEKAAALEKADDILTVWQYGDATEDSFAELAKIHSTDDGSRNNGGLYTDVYPGQMVRTFEAWCFADGRKPGDTGLVKSDYGVHIMYYVSDSELTYREFQIISDMAADDLEAWQSELWNSVTVTQIDLSHANRNITLKKASAQE